MLSQALLQSGHLIVVAIRNLMAFRKPALHLFEQIRNLILSDAASFLVSCDCFIHQTGFFLVVERANSVVLVLLLFGLGLKFGLLVLR